MNQFDQGSAGQTTGGSSDGIYVVLMAVAVIALAVAVGVVAWRNLDLVGSDAGNNPFYVVSQVVSTIQALLF